MKAVIKDLTPPLLYKLARNLLRKSSYPSGHVGTRNLKILHKRYQVTHDDYHADLFFNDIHSKYGINSLRGVAVDGLSEEENTAWYTSNRFIFEGMLRDLSFPFDSANVLEIGYGVGSYTEVCRKLGVPKYLGVDISDHHIEKLQAKFPSYKFLKADVGTMDVLETGGNDDKFDLIFMIDVSQHMVNDKKLEYCLRENVIKKLKPGGIFIVTDELENKKYSFSEKSRSLEFYSRILELDVLQVPIPFHWKYIFSYTAAPQSGGVHTQSPQQPSAPAHPTTQV